MSALVLLNLLNEFGKKDGILGSSIFFILLYFIYYYYYATTY